MRIVLDASFAISTVVRNDRRQAELLSEATSTIAPDLFVSEVANSFWKYTSGGHLVIPQAVQMMESTLALVDYFVESIGLWPEVLAEATRLKHSAYDLSYVVLARREAARLATLDKRMKSLARKVGVKTLSVS